MSLQMRSTRPPVTKTCEHYPTAARLQVARFNAANRRAARTLRRADSSVLFRSACAASRAAPIRSSRPGSAVGVMASELRVMIFGAPAAGKGTQCARIVEKYGLVHISVGDLLRAEVANGTPAGKKAKAFMDAGDLVPNEVVVEMVKSRLAEDDVKSTGWLLDGYPRSLEQAEAIEKEGIRPDVFLLVEVPDDILVDRVTGRRLDPETGEIYHLTYKPPPAEVVPRLTQRSDDTEEKVRNRLATYHRNLDSVLGMYTDAIVRVDGSRDFDEVFAQIEEVLDKARGGEEQVAATA